MEKKYNYVNSFKEHTLFKEDGTKNYIVVDDKGVKKKVKRADWNKIIKTL